MRAKRTAISSTHILRRGRRQSPKFPFKDPNVDWTIWVFAFTAGPMFFESVGFSIYEKIIPAADLTQKQYDVQVSAALENFLTWCLVVGLALAGLGQYLQALAHRWKGNGGQRFGTVGVLVGIGGWATGLFAGILFPIAASPESEGSLHLAMAIGFAGPVVVTCIVLIGRAIQHQRAHLKAHTR